ncbi:winged helix-turn-helix domain-containing protein [Zavarzinella formosa]|uniref:winged helix-turn-helix domain-containing protein n=1 Tax=Zavarzinella formosa TaxID=360055 RepID=UPI0003058F0C|nr:winged helix-turn-helix domain-containing protein [Zavarzinella formosa]
MYPASLARGDAEFLSPAEYARRSGLSKATVSRRLKDGSLPRLQPGGPGTRVLIPAAALQIPASPVPKALDSRPNPAPHDRPRGPRPAWKRRP